MHKSAIRLLIVVLFFLLMVGTFYYFQIYDRSLVKIINRGSITLLTTYGPTTYYKYRESEMGFEYDLAKGFADSLGVDLNIIVTDWHDIIPLLKHGKGDFIGNGMTITPLRKMAVMFSAPYLHVEQHIVSHKNRRLHDLQDLDNRTITVRKNSAYADRLHALSSDNTSFIVAIENGVSTESLIQRVNDNMSFITVADSLMMHRMTRFYPNIRMRFEISEDQELGWAVRKGDSALKGAIDRYLRKMKNDGTMDNLKEKYFSKPDICDCYDAYKFHKRLKTRFPKYEKAIKNESAKYGFDWRLVAAVVYQESHFDRYARSHTGVRGLMQLTKDTAERMGVENRLDPHQSVMGGVKYLHLLYDRYPMVSKEDRMDFTLASYNVGPGHVRDAMALATEMGLPPNKWASIRKTLPLLAKRKYYKKSKYGYTRGWEGVSYVTHVNKYYDILQMYEINANMADMILK